MPKNMYHYEVSDPEIKDEGFLLFGGFQYALIKVNDRTLISDQNGSLFSINDLREAVTLMEEMLESARSTLDYYREFSDLPERMSLLRRCISVRDQDIQILESKQAGKGIYIYLMYDPISGEHKIGISGNLKQRLRNIRKDRPKTTIVSTFMGPMYEEIYLHNRFHKNRSNGEWFIFSDDDLIEVANYFQNRRQS